MGEEPCRSCDKLGALLLHQGGVNTLGYCCDDADPPSLYCVKFVGGLLDIRIVCVQHVVGVLVQVPFGGVWCPLGFCDNTC
jgi:hypothetical protein